MVELGKAEALLPPRECIPGENYAPGERIRCLLLNIENTTRGPEIILSVRASSSCGGCSSWKWRRSRTAR